MDLCKYRHFYYMEIIMFKKLTFIKRRFRIHIYVVQKSPVNISLRAYIYYF